METKKYRICNIVSDEKFIDSAIEGLDLYSDIWETDWVICSKKNNKLKYITKYPDRINTLVEDNLIDYIKTHVFDAVILHSFSVISPATIIRIPKNIKLFWFGWGYDIYNFPAYKPFLKWNLFKPQTRKYLNSFFYKRLRQFAMKITFLLKRKGKIYNKALNRVDFFSGVVDFEYELLKRNSSFRAQKVSFTYSSLSWINSFDIIDNYSGDNILVGNSAAITNNHLDVLEYLKKMNIGDRKIILPLSYAGPEYYVKHIEESYKSIFGNKIVFLIDYMPYNEYKQHILSCSTAVFFMERQQATGNIVTALKSGCKVFLSASNPLYVYYRNIGITLFSVENDLNNENLDKPLNQTEIDNNRAILKSLYNYDSYMKKLKTIYDAIEDTVPHP